MKCYTYLKEKKDELTIRNYVEEHNIKVDEEKKYYLGFEEESEKKREADIEKDVFPVLIKGDVLIVPELNTLGNSTLVILNRLEMLKTKEITLHLIKEALVLEAENESLYSLISALLDCDKKFKKKRILEAKATREKNGNKVGRPSGKKTKSMFDTHKRKIMSLHKRDVPKTKILLEIKKDDLGLEKATSQALGKYIKRLEPEQLLKIINRKANKLLGNTNNSKAKNKKITQKENQTDISSEAVTKSKELIQEDQHKKDSKVVNEITDKKVKPTIRKRRKFVVAKKKRFQSKS